MPIPIQLIVGLGNPGAKYANTRHNAGAWFVDALTRLTHCTLRPEAKLLGMHAVASLCNQECHLVIPTTYMNESGLCVRAVANYYKIPPAAILIVHDELDLPAGVARLKLDGGAGGHNGLTDIIEHLHTKQFCRLRIGIGHPGNSRDVVDYVLKAPSKSDRLEIDAALQQAEDALPLILAGDFPKAMQKLHSEPSE